jgi:hypothetical protein
MNTTFAAIPPKHKPTPQTAWLILALTLVALAAATILFLYNPAQFRFYPVCLFHQSTGLLCPGCGCLRAIHQLLHGNIAMALHFNALLVVSLPLAAWYGIRLVLQQIRSASLPIIRLRWVWAAVAVVLLFSVLRNLPFIHLPWLTP